MFFFLFFYIGDDLLTGEDEHDIVVSSIRVRRINMCLVICSVKQIKLDKLLKISNWFQ